MKRLVIVVLALVLVGAGVAVWWWARSAPTSTTASPQITGFVEADQLSISSPLNPSSWDAASPLELEVTLLRPPAPRTEWTAERPWWNELALYRVDGEAESPVAFEVIEPRERPAADDEVQFVTLAIAAGELPVGPATLRPLLRYADGGTLVGNELSGRVATGVRTARARSLAEARVHVAAGRFDEALAALDGIEFAQMADAQIVRADALAGAGRVDEAIALLHAALAQVPPDLPEPPTAILRRLRQLEQGGAQ